MKIAKIVDDPQLQGSKREALARQFRQVYQHGFFNVLVIYPVTIVSVGVSVLLFFGFQWALPVSGVAVVSYALILLIWQYVYIAMCERKIEITEAENNELEISKSRLGAQFASHIRNQPDYYTMKYWHEELRVAVNGDTEIVRTVHLVPGLNGIDFAFQNLYSVDESDIEAIKVRAAVINEDNTRSPRQTIDVWEEKGRKLSSFVDLGNHYPSTQGGGVVKLETIWTWPSYFKKLLTEGREAHDIKMSRSCADFKLSLKLEKMENLSGKGLTVSSLQSKPGLTYVACQVSHTGDNQSGFEVICTAQNLSPRQRFGFWMELTESP